MKRLLFLFLLFPILVKAQSPVIISQPYLFQKYISVKDSAFLTGTLLNADSSAKFATTKFVKQNIRASTFGLYQLLNGGNTITGIQNLTSGLYLFEYGTTLNFENSLGNASTAFKATSQASGNHILYVPMNITDTISTNAFVRSLVGTGGVTSFNTRIGAVVPQSADYATFYYKQLVPTAVKTAAYTASAQDLVYTNTTSGNVPITLPNAPVNGTLILVKMITLGGGNVTSITTSGSDVFNKTGGSTTLTLSYVNQGLLLQYNSGIWTVLSDDLPVGAVTSIASSYAPQNYYYTATGSEGTSITISSIINMVVTSINRQGLEFQKITTGSPNGNQTLVNGSTGALTFANALNSGDAIHVTYASATSPTPTAPIGLQILYAANYATASTYFTGSNTLLVVVKNDEVNGGTNPDGSYATTIYTYSYNNSTGSKLFFVRTAAQ